MENGNSVAAITPAYEFWANVWRGMVVRGSADMFVPFGHESIREVNARTSFGGNLAAGYYFTPHDAAPFGDLVFHVATTLTQLTDNRGPNTTTSSSPLGSATTSAPTSTCSLASTCR